MRITVGVIVLAFALIALAIVNNTMADSRVIWKIDRFDGGLSFHPRVAPPGAYLFGYGINVDNRAGYLFSSKKPTRIATTTYQVRYIAQGSDFNTYLFSANGSGSALVYSGDIGFVLVRTVGVTSYGGSLVDFNGKLYYRNDTTLGSFDYAATWNDSAQIGLASSNTYNKKIVTFRNLLLVANGRYLATLDDAGTWNATRLTFPPGYNVVDMVVTQSYVAIVTRTPTNNTVIFLWNGSATAYNDYIPIYMDTDAAFALYGTIFLVGGSGEEFGVYELTSRSVALAHRLPSGYVTISNVAAGSSKAFIFVYQNTSELNPINQKQSNTVLSFMKNGQGQYVINTPYIPEAGTGSSTLASALYAYPDYTQEDNILIGANNGATYGLEATSQKYRHNPAVYRSIIFDNGEPYILTPDRWLIELENSLITDEYVVVTLNSDPYNDPTYANSSNLHSVTFNTVGQSVFEYSFGTVNLRSRTWGIEIKIYRGSAVDTETTPGIRKVWTQFVRQQPDSL